MGVLPEGAPADALRKMLAQANADFRDKAPLSAAGAAAIILDGVRSGAWRILVGEDAKKLDAQVRAKPEACLRLRRARQLAGHRAGGRGAEALTSHAPLSRGLAALRHGRWPGRCRRSRWAAG